MPASYIIKTLWDIDWDIADFGFRSAERHFTATRCLTTPLAVISEWTVGWSLSSTGKCDLTLVLFSDTYSIKETDIFFDYKTCVLCVFLSNEPPRLTQ